MHACPGARVVREPTPEDVTCPHCGHEVEIWSDEARARCRCGAWVYRDQGVSCLDWCASAERCVGAEELARYRASRKGLP